MRNTITNGGMKGIKGVTLADLDTIDKTTCAACASGKQTRAPALPAIPPEYHATAIMDRWWCDLAGPIVVSMAGVQRQFMSTIKYLLVVVDEYSRYTMVVPLAKKSQAESELKRLILLHNTRTGTTLKELHHDGGKEFLTLDFKCWLTGNGTSQTTTTFDTPRRNAVAERKIRHIIETSRTVLVAALLPPVFWIYAVKYSVYCINRMVLKSSGNVTPAELFTGVKPNLRHSHTFGSDCQVLIPKQKRATKIDAVNTNAIYLGVDTTTGTHALWDPITNKVTSSPDVIILDNQHQLPVMAGGDGTPILERAEVGTVTFDMSLDRQMSELFVPAPVPMDVDDGDNTSSTNTSNTSSKIDQLNKNLMSDFNLDVTTSSTVPSVPPAPPPVSSLSTLRATSAPLVTGDLNRNGVIRNGVPNTTITSAVPVSSLSGLVPPTVLPVYFACTSSTTTVDSIKSCKKRAKEMKRAVRHIFSAATSAPLVNTGTTGTNGTTITVVIPEPNNFTAAMNSKYRDQWYQAMVKEMESQRTFGTWVLVPVSSLPPGKIPIACRWVLKVKYQSTGAVDKFKARIVAKGFMQIDGVDYGETFAPTAKLKSIKLLLALVVQQNLELKQLDYRTAFLNANMDEVLFMEQAPGFVVPPTNGSTSKDQRLVCLLIKSLYGTKQAPRNWYKQVNALMVSLGFTPLISDSCIYVRTSSTGRLMMVSLYVDDKLVAYHHDDTSEWNDIKRTIGGAFAIDDIGDCHWILQMLIVRDRTAGTLQLSQMKYINSKVAELLPADGTSNTKKTGNPCLYEHLTEQLQVDGAPPVPLVTPSDDDHHWYRSAVGSLMYAALNTRIDICYATNLLARYVTNPQPHHFAAARHCINYLRGTSSLALTFRSSGASTTTRPNVAITAFSDSDWGGCRDTRRSTTGYIVLVNGNVVHWCSTRQRTVATSSTEAEYMALAEVAKEISWFASWLTEVQVLVPSSFVLVPPAVVQVDNSAAIALTKEGAPHQRSKHIDVRYHFIRDKVATGVVKVNWLPTTAQMADVLTKRLPTKSGTTGTNFNSIQSVVAQILSRTDETVPPPPEPKPLVFNYDTNTVEVQRANLVMVYGGIQREEEMCSYNTTAVLPVVPPWHQ